MKWNRRSTLQTVQDGVQAQHHHAAIRNYTAVPRHQSELICRPTLPFGTILPSHVVIRELISVPRRQSELFSVPRRHTGTIFPCHVVNQNYTSAPRRHMGTNFLPTSSTRTIFRPLSSSGKKFPSHVVIHKYSSVRSYTQLPVRTRKHKKHTYTRIEN